MPNDVLRERVETLQEGPDPAFWELFGLEGDRQSLERFEERFPGWSDALRGLVMAGAGVDDVRRFAVRARWPSVMVDWIEAAARALAAERELL